MGGPEPDQGSDPCASCCPWLRQRDQTMMDEIECCNDGDSTVSDDDGNTRRIPEEERVCVFVGRR